VSIDLVFTGKGIKVKNFKVLDIHLRNHSQITLEFTVPQSLQGGLDTVKIFLDQARLETLILEKYQVILQNDITDKNIDGFYKNVLSVIEEAKSQKVKTPRKSQPWFDQECYNLRQQLNFLRHIFVNFPLNDQFKDEKREILEIIALG